MVVVQVAVAVELLEVLEGMVSNHSNTTMCTCRPMCSVHHRTRRGMLHLVALLREAIVVMLVVWVVRMEAKVTEATEVLEGTRSSHSNKTKRTFRPTALDGLRNFRRMMLHLTHSLTEGADMTILTMWVYITQHDVGGAGRDNKAVDASRT